MRIRRISIVAILAALVATFGSLVQRQFAQRELRPKTPVVFDERVQDADRFNLDGLEFERKLVKGVPFSATLTVETTQSGADGSTRTRTATSLIFRDAEGRTRRDRWPIQTSGSEPSPNQQPQNSTISDPVAGFIYRLEHGTRLYRRAVFRSWSASGSDDAKVIMTPSLSSAAPAKNSRSLPLPMTSDHGYALKKATIVASSEMKNEQLGERQIEGVKAEGTRISTSIPAGAIANEQPMEIIVERWYSAELQTPIMIKRSDPRVGEIVYRLIEISRGEQSGTLFVVPSGYKMSLEK